MAILISAILAHLLLLVSNRRRYREMGMIFKARRNPEIWLNNLEQVC